MQKKRLEQIILVILIPGFILSLLYMHLREKKTLKAAYELQELKPKFEEDERIDKIPKPAGTAEVKYEGNARDPLKDLLQIYLYKLRLKKERAERALKGEEKELEEKIALPEINIEGLVWNTDRPQAIINGEVIRIGDSIAGAKIIEIEKQGITVIYQGKTAFVPKR